MALELPRRKFLTGLLGLVAAPAVVRAASLMPVRSIPLLDSTRAFQDAIDAAARLNVPQILYSNRTFRTMADFKGLEQNDWLYRMHVTNMQESV